MSSKNDPDVVVSDGEEEKIPGKFIIYLKPHPFFGFSLNNFAIWVRN